MNVLIVGGAFSVNKGAVAMSKVVFSGLRDRYKNAHFIFATPFPKLDRKYCDRNNITIIERKSQPLKSFYEAFLALFVFILGKIGLKVNVASITKDQILATIQNASVVVDISGDIISDDYGKRTSIGALLSIAICKMLGKKYIIFPQSIGPFSGISAVFARVILSKVDLIMAREKITYKILENLGVKNCKLVPDLAFLLESKIPMEVEKITKPGNKRIVGVNLNYLIDKRDKESKNAYFEKKVELISYIKKHYHPILFFIPHVINPLSGEDDIRLIKEIKKLHLKDVFYFDQRDYSVEEIKGIIGKCDIFIGSRMHSNISSISQNVPTLAIGYSHKYFGIMELMGMRKYVIDYRHFKVQDAINKFNSLWKNQLKIREGLQKKNKKIKQLAVKSFDYFGKVVNCSF